MTSATRLNALAAGVAAIVVGCSAGGNEQAPRTAPATPAAGTPQTTPSGLATSPAQGLYGVDLSRGLVYVDPATAAATVVGPLALTVFSAGADFDCDGTMWAFSAVDEAMALYTVDLATGAASVAKSFAVPGLSTNSGFEFGPDERTPFWRNGTSLYTLDAAAGTVKLVGSGGGGGVSLTMPASCDQFLAGDCSGADCRLARIDPVTAAVTVIGSTGAFAFTSLAAAPDGSLYAHAGGKLYRLDTTTGTPTLIGTMVLDDETPIQPVGMAYGPRGVCCRPLDRPLDCDTAGPTVTTLWPPNHRLVEVGIQGLAGSGGAPVTVAVTGVRQDEPVNARGDGNTAPDAFLDGGAVRLRAERSGGGDGRVYHLDFTATSGDRSCQGSVQVCVPHDQGQGLACVDQGPLHDSTVP